MAKKNARAPYLRLAQPLVRDSGALRPATWDEALDRAAEGFRRNVERHGPDAVGMFSCSKATNEMNFVAQKFTRVVDRHQQHRLLQPHLTRPQRRRSGDSLRCRRRHHRPTREVEDTDVIVLWGSNAREAHPIFFHHVLRAFATGRALFVVDPRRTSTARVGRRLARPRRRHRHRRWPTRSPARSSPPAWRTGASSSAPPPASTSSPRSVEPWTLERRRGGDRRPRRGDPASWPTPSPRPTGPSCAGRSASPSTTTRVDNVLALINLALLCGHVGPLRLGPQPAAGPEQRAGRRRHGRDPQPPARLPGHPRRRGAGAASSGAWGSRIPPRYGLHLTQMFDAMDDGELTRPVRDRARTRPSPRPTSRTPSSCLEGLDHLVVQDIFLTKTAELADVVLPASAAWCETEGTVTNSERRVQRVRKAIEPPGGRPRRHRDHLSSWPAASATTGLRRRRRGDLGRAARRSRRCTRA